MNIIEETRLVLEFNLEEYKAYSFHKGDIIMYKGDTYIVYEINNLTNDPYTVYLKLELFKRAINYYLINKAGILFKVADYNINCKKDKEL